MIYYKDKKYNFVEYFDEVTGVLVRSNVLKNSVETCEMPKMRSFPELIDIGIMGTCVSAENKICKNAGIDCYQNASKRKRPNMSYEDYCKIIEQSKNKTFQVALGGSGDPNKHEYFGDILATTRKNFIVPNLTTSGMGMTDSEVSLMKKYCGAVAVSYYSKLNHNGEEDNPSTISAINKLVDAGCVTNVHYVLSKKNIKEALYRLDNNLFPNGINAIIFLLYKPVGLASKENMLSYLDLEYIELIKSVSRYQLNFSIGFDSCQSPAINMFSKDVAAESIQFCDAARFSMYIDCEMKAHPCSFGIETSNYSFDLKANTLEAAWDSASFQKFRDKQVSSCSYCDILHCRNCALELDINVCGAV